MIKIQVIILVSDAIYIAQRLLLDTMTLWLFKSAFLGYEV